MKRNIAVVGLGYVGLPVAVAFGQLGRVIGFDINERRIEELKNKQDRTNEVMLDELQAADIHFTSNPENLRQSDFIIVTVPTPINGLKQPDLAPLIEASKLIGENLQKGTIVVYESTVYPGVTEEECLPLLEQYSHLKANKDFFVGYSPERVNPGDRTNTFAQINKIISAQTPEIAQIIHDTYSLVVKADLYIAETIKVAEAAKVIENTQRDLNIALMNEFAMIFESLNIDTQEVLKAARTKWNFLPFEPGLVGGHCISVDPYYLTYKAQAVGYDPHMILAGRRINDGMSHYIVTTLIRKMIEKGMLIKQSKITVLGTTFKEDVPDTRNSKVFHIIQELQDMGITVQWNDSTLPINVITGNQPIENLEKTDVVILAVPHQAYRKKDFEIVTSLLKPEGILIDVKGVMDKATLPSNTTYWRL
ncbi:nucleotide sugar dehydrogenase [Listeria aquatica]|uniref:nucleotide sugar dehydrogenase n=1 Tax=Listeria aquatica TaxID=1494960 RepID=UPI0031F5AD6D